MRTYWLILVLLAVTSQTGFAQGTTLNRTAELKGQVYVARDAPAPAGAMVQLERSDSGNAGNAQTDARGKFEFRGLAPRPYVLRVRLHGYETHEENVDLTLNTRAYVVINLRQLPGKDSRNASSSADTVQAREAGLPASAVKEFENGKNLLLEKKDVDGGISHLKKAIKIHDNFPQAYVLLGVALSAQNNLQAAEDAYVKAIRLDEGMGDAYIALGMLQNQQKKFADAQRTLTRAVKLKPDSFEAHYELGKSYWATGQVAESEPHAQKAVQMRADFPPAHVLLGNIALRKNDPQSALKEFNEYLRLDPNGPWAQPVREQINKIENSAVLK